MPKLSNLKNSKETSDEEKKKIGWIELIRELSHRLKHEIFLLAFLFALLVMLVAIATPHYSIWVAASFIALYFISVGFYFALKTKDASSELKEKSREYVRYLVGYPPAFQNPYVVAREKGPMFVAHFDISFDVTNSSSKPLIVKVYVQSPTQAVGFVWEKLRKIWRRRFGIIPYRKELEFALDDMQACRIDPSQTEHLDFHGLYRSYLAFRDYELRTRIVIKFRIYAESEEDFLHKIYFDTGEKRISVIFRDKVRYKKTS